LTTVLFQYIIAFMRNGPDDRLELIDSPRKAAVLMNPLRAAVLRSAVEPASATELAGRLGLTRQRVNYHVRALARAGLLRRAGRRRKRNMIEQRYVATARSYVLSPDVLGPAGAQGAAGERGAEDEYSAARLMLLAARSQSELGRSMQAAAAEGKRLSTLSIETALRFESAEQRAEFAEALRTAVLDVVARHASPMEGASGESGPGRPYRLLIGCHPIPRETEG
jgi:DNA-binding transcriptional ArsR family regulator